MRTNTGPPAPRYMNVAVATRREGLKRAPSLLPLRQPWTTAAALTKRCGPPGITCPPTIARAEKPRVQLEMR